MSNWTHVVAIARVDHLRGLFCSKPDFEKIFGKELHYEDSGDKWDYAEAHPDEFLPIGSEGSLTMSVWENPDKSSLAAYTVSIFGDLRNHDNPDEIVEWFKEKCENLTLWCRNACIVAHNEWIGTRFWHLEEKKED